MKDVTYLTSEYEKNSSSSEIISSLVDARKRQHITQKELSAKTGITQADISRIEKGLRNPSLSMVERLAAGIGMSLKLENSVRTEPATILYRDLSDWDSEGYDLVADPYEEYKAGGQHTAEELGYAWYTAIGLQAVDGLKTSSYLEHTAKECIEGKITLEQASSLIEGYYEKAEERAEIEANDRTKEADLVSTRIARILADRSFTLSAAEYVCIHKQLFAGIYSHAGKLRTYNISKKEWVLDGDTVSYGNASSLRALLDYDLGSERDYRYVSMNAEDMIPHLAKFVARLWQIHAFGEGNTRTTAVFFIEYLRSMGFPIDNNVFAENAWYFRNALVRANYRNVPKGIAETTEYLELFLRNLLLDEKNELKNRYLHVRWRNEASI